MKHYFRFGFWPWWQQHKRQKRKTITSTNLGAYSLKRPRLTGKGILIINLRRPHQVYGGNSYIGKTVSSLWRHLMETFPELLTFCAGNSPVTGEFSAQRPVTRSFDVLFELRLNQQLSKQWRRLWIETPSWWLWRHCNVLENRGPAHYFGVS